MKKVIALSLLVVLTIGCKSKKTAADNMNDDSLTILKQDGYGGRETESHQLVNSQSEFEALSKELNIQDAPKVDFSKNSVIAVFMGQKSTGGYSISIEKALFTAGSPDVLTVLVKTTRPGKDDMVTMALTTPYCVAVIPKTKKVDIEYIKSSFNTSKMRRE